jgi:methylated-DNA-[protein]-cysteine S-methyltransferase
VSSSRPDPAQVLRSHGLRSTPQRRAILAAFRGGPSEHLSADEVHARASQVLPDLGRGTVYATLAEFTELDLLAAFGAPEPVRYETNTASHDHFRCRLCLRIFDLDGPPRVEFANRDGFAIERIEVRAEGVCAECNRYEDGLERGAGAIIAEPVGGAALEGRGVAGAEMEGPLGPLYLAASSDGLLRVAFKEHADAERIEALIGSRRGGEGARAHLAQAIDALRRYLGGEGRQVECAIDWDALGSAEASALMAVRDVPYGERRSYQQLPVDLGVSELGRSLGANPIPLLAPCHRITRGVEVPEAFVGGAARREWLLQHEREHASPA